jgi:ABC-2 type transport system permease protein
MNLSKIFVIASREYIAVVRSKAFVISLILLPLMVFGSIAIQTATSKVKDLHDRHFAVIDRTPGEGMYAAIQTEVQKRNSRMVVDGRQTEPFFRVEKYSPEPVGDSADGQRIALSRMVREGSLGAFVEIGGDVGASNTASSARPTDDPHIVRYESANPIFNEFRQIVSESINKSIQARRMSEAGISPKIFAQIVSPVPMVDKGLAEMGTGGQISYSGAGAEIVGYMVPFGLAMLMFVVVMVGAVPLLQGVVEEKQNRIAEVLLGSVRPFELMAGKVLGLVGTSVTLIVLYLAAAFYGMVRTGMAEFIPLRVIPWFLLFQILSVLMYGSLYIAIGASVNEPKELQSLMLPLNLVGVLPILVLGNILQNPNGPIAVAGTWFPLSSPIITVTRMAIPPGIPFTEAIGAAGIVLVATLVLVYAAGRIFRVGILMQGKPPRIADLARWAIRG